MLTWISLRVFYELARSGDVRESGMGSMSILLSATRATAIGTSLYPSQESQEIPPDLEHIMEVTYLIRFLMRQDPSYYCAPAYFEHRKTPLTLRSRSLIYPRGPRTSSQLGF